MSTKITVAILVSVTLICSCAKEQVVNNSNNNGTSNLKDTTILNVPYGTHASQVYDIFLPAKRDIHTPVVLMMHGGAWKAGQKEDFNYIMNLIKNKWNNVALVNMNYRLASNAKNIHHQ